MSRSIRSIRLAVGLAAAFAIGLIAGCHSDQKDAARVASSFAESLKSGDQATFKSLLTKEGQAHWNQSIADETGKNQKPDSYTVGEAVITDQTASVPLAIKDEKGQSETDEIRLRKEDGSWKVYAMSIPAGNTTVTLDFEHPEAFVGDMMRAAGQQVGEGFKALGQGFQAFADGFKAGINGTPAKNANSH